MHSIVLYSTVLHHSQYIVLLIYCYVDIIQQNAMHKFVGVLHNFQIMATYFVSIGNNINSCALPVASPTNFCAFLPMTSKADKLPLEAEPVTTNQYFHVYKLYMYMYM